MTKRGPYARGRIQVLADIDRIRDELCAGLTYRSMYERRKAKLDIGYSQFYKLLIRYVPDARPVTLKATDAQRSNANYQAAAKSRTDTVHSGISDPALIRRLTKGD